MTAGEKLKLLDYGGILLGIGLAGAFDGIVFHQLLQWHSVYMHTHRHGQIVSDGVFHAFTVVALAVSAVMLWRAGHPGGLARGKRLLVSGALLGAGGFNVVEGIVNHHLLQLHHVKQGDPYELLYDLAYLAVSALIFAYGLYLRQGGRAEGRSSDMAR
ncbi:DUF2243 domain-containing protein [Paenibacillus sp.]|uniref:DUF2243 domain-containing protein n=1 Tax=Paenibacillus sp. TaxID=58172 RepID=UPI002811F8FE|nr:DUF2243 domain-containing protein [Paenibacillus sp.]